MADDRTRALLHPFDTGILPPPAGPVLFLNAPRDATSPLDLSIKTIFVQGFRPAFNALERAGRRVTPASDGTGFATALILTGRHRRQNEIWIADALERTASGGLIVVSGSKDDGIASLRKRLGDMIEIEGSEAKYHGVAFWFRRPDKADEIIEVLRGPQSHPLVEGRFVTSPGMFSADHIDAGSRLLAEHLPRGLSGYAADFCAGWGYLSCELASRCPKIKSIDLYEADHASIEAARKNMAVNAPDMKADFFWHDLVGEPVAERYDVVLMNPPFHAGRAAEPGIGQALIAAAAKAIRRSGRLLLVANRQLPYEQTLSKHFARTEKLADERGFKILMAVK